MFKLIKVLLRPIFPVAEFFVRNDFSYPIRKRQAKKIVPRIAVIYMLDYFHHYLEDAICGDERFVLRHSRNFPRKDASIPFFDPKDLSTMDVVLPETTNCFIEGFTKRHRVLMRIQHSPGFSMKDPISPYPLIKRIGGRLMIPKDIWDFILQADFLDDETKKIREMILYDGTPIFLTYYDPKMNAIYNLPRRVTRKLDKVLVAVNWKTFKDPEDVRLLVKSIRFLHDEKMRVSVRLHPLINVFLKSTIMAFRQQLDVMDIEIMLSEGSSIRDLVDLYDEHEFIVTDGSGSVYEAISRGCKALTLEGLSIQSPKGNFFPVVKLGILPKTTIWDFKNHPGHSFDMKLLMKLHGRSLISKDISRFIAEEIVDAFKNWNTRNYSH